METQSSVFVHETATVEAEAVVGDGCRIWHLVHIRSGACLGTECIVGRGAFIDTNVRIGSRCKLQNYVLLYDGVELEDGVFVGPHACFTNDRIPRAINPDGSLKSVDDWKVTRTFVKTGASIGANATIVCGVTIGRWAMIGSGSVVCKDVPDHAIVVGNPAVLIGWITSAGVKVSSQEEAERYSAAEFKKVRQTL